jgi:hypothetical protein
MKLSFFDFDDTLFKLPYTENTDYMDNNGSLSPLKWTFEPKQNIINQYRVESNKKGVKVILLSNRTTNVIDSLKEFLNSQDIKFDYYRLIEGGNGDRLKSKRMENLIKKYPNTTNIEYWEDKDKHILDVKSMIQKYPNIDIKINKVT